MELLATLAIVGFIVFICYKVFTRKEKNPPWDDSGSKVDTHPRDLKDR